MFVPYHDELCPKSITMLKRNSDSTKRRATTKLLYATSTCRPRSCAAVGSLLAVAFVVLMMSSNSTTFSQRSLASASVEDQLFSSRRSMKQEKTTPKARASETIRSRNDDTPTIEQNNIDRNINNKSLRFVWHVGPMKTATTTIQLGLGGMEKSNTLKRDSWVYAKFPFLNNKEKFWPTFQSTMEEYRQQGLNVVVSSENYSISFREPDYKKVQELLQDDWDIEVVIGYRPYFEWVPSHWAQKQKLRTMGQSKPNDPIPNISWRNEEDGSWKKPVEPMFPHFYNKIGPLFADSVYDFASPHLPVTMLHMYNQKPLRTKFVCDILRAEASCERSQKKDSETNKTTHANGKSLDEIHVNALVLEAAANDWIDINQWSRATLMTAVTKHLNKTRQQTVFDLPFKCPDAATLEELLWGKTIDMEQKIFPQLAASEGREAELRDGFQKLIDRRTYCRLDLDAILNDLKWQVFFAQYKGTGNKKSVSQT